MAFTGNNLRTHDCLECGKFRLYLPLGQEPSNETQIFDLPNGEKKAFYKEMCEWCRKRLWQKHFAPKPTDIKKVLRAIEKGKLNESLEDVL